VTAPPSPLTALTIPRVTLPTARSGASATRRERPSLCSTAPRGCGDPARRRARPNRSGAGSGAVSQPRRSGEGAACWSWGSGGASATASLPRTCVCACNVSHVCVQVSYELPATPTTCRHASIAGRRTPAGAPRDGVSHRFSPGGVAKPLRHDPHDELGEVGRLVHEHPEGARRNLDEAHLVLSDRRQRAEAWTQSARAPRRSPAPAGVEDVLAVLQEDRPGDDDVHHIAVRARRTPTPRVPSSAPPRLVPATHTGLCPTERTTSSVPSFGVA